MKITDISPVQGSHMKILIIYKTSQGGYISINLADKVAEEATKMELYEAYVAEKINEGRSIIGLYPLTSEEFKIDFEQWKKERS